MSLKEKLKHFNCSNVAWVRTSFGIKTTGAEIRPLLELPYCSILRSGLGEGGALYRCKGKVERCILEGGPPKI